ncbi:MAG: class I SAM-dependent methyltransferase [Actinomycetota bacterium]
MFKKKVEEIFTRLKKYNDLRTSAPMQRDFTSKVKHIYSRLVFFALTPLINRQNAYNRATFDYNQQIFEHLEDIDTKIGNINEKIREFNQRLDSLEYKVFVDFPPGFDYSQFEDQFRGPEDKVKERQKIYLGYLNKNLPTLDIGCGRGEFLELLAEAGFKAYGIDTSIKMVERCRNRGLYVAHSDAVSYLKNYEGSLGNVFMSQIVEHMDYKDTYEVIRLAWEKMEEEAVILIETVNPNSFYAQSRGYVIDPTHVKLVSPETLSYTYQKVGFRNLRIIYKSPVPKGERLKLLGEEVKANKDMKKILSKLNSDLKKLDDIIFGNLEYAILGVK